jgi:two-component system cell cycle sensor histidine kinase/response regulator CckA
MQTILLVDDEPTLLRLCQQILGLGGYEVLLAGNAEEALRLLQNNAGVDLVLSDVVMPGMNGIELAKRIQNNYPHTKIALMTGYDAGEIRRFAGEDNPYRVIWKPFKTESLLRMIENVLDSSAQPA